ncbi:MAG: hypothetical protein ACHQQQ_12900 [Bacteroidota bacterium]
MFQPPLAPRLPSSIEEGKSRHQTGRGGQNQLRTISPSLVPSLIRQTGGVVIASSAAAERRLPDFVIQAGDLLTSMQIL